LAFSGICLIYKNSVENDQLSNLPGARLSEVKWDASFGCLSGTRTGLLDEILDWIRTGSESILWLSGALGTGKSAVTNSLAEKLDHMKLLGAFFRFSRSIQGITPKHLFGSIAFQMALVNRSYEEAVLAALTQYRSFDSQSLDFQAEHLILQPLAKLEFGCKIVIIIEALDESGTDEAIAGLANRSALVKCIVTKFGKLPSFVKIIITARNEGSIQNSFVNKSFIIEKRMDQVMDAGSDIITYFGYQFKQIRNDHPTLSEDWPGKKKETQLVDAADNLFVWAVVACSLIQDDPYAQLDMLLKLDFRLQDGARLEKLYAHILETNYITRDIQNWHYVVGTIVVLQKPLTVQSIDSLLGLSITDYSKTLITGHSITLSSSKLILKKMLPLMKNQLDADPVQLLHKSVYDFLMHEAKVPFRIDIRTQNLVLAMQCLQHMNQNLKCNICDMKDTALLNSEISEPVEYYIPESVQYACCFFFNHLESGSVRMNQEFCKTINTFIQEHILHWIEVMSWLEKIGHAAKVLNSFLEYLVCY